ncbi:sensor histidine kinase [Mucilaginibacter sp. OK283]|uniref:sensor histidine kinase n=1 Tax=Mucilaginibacter sp. OK283 TaxID=1881049 RepID=UPI0008CF6A5F|nr:histidine kinase [Mucilaginibacter sp. OK283]SEO09565.1 Histidine kinase [Mucilaginibacter sp. OK283]
MFKQITFKFKNDVTRIEFWVVTGCIIAALILSIFDIIRNNQIAANNMIQAGQQAVTPALLSATLMPILFSYLVTFIIYLLLCFYLTPAFEGDGGTALNGSLLIFIFIALSYLVGIISIYFAALLALKILFIYFNRNRQNGESALYYEASLLTASWILITIGLLYVSTPVMLHFYILYDVAAAMVLYLYAVHVLLPNEKLKNKNIIYYFFRMFLLAALSSLAVYLICLSFKGGSGLSRPAAIFVLVIDIGDAENIAWLVFLNFLTQLFIVMPLARTTYKRRNAKKDEEIKTLKTELGQSDANLNFLKSQINPHFLFNALNTLYGTALQENAERTGEGIQKLGDMMRFMLEENVRDRILLSRDIDYLKNYILLQKLRTSASSSIIIETQIEDYQGALMITPMLLIPFVENAFKHGISLQNPSHIKVTLQTDGNTLYFDVHNSIHIRHDNDPEKGQSGIGLDNVKQRLALLYPNRHDLVIRENAKEFFIHLTVQLDII